VATINVSNDGDGVISDYNRNFYLLSVNSLQEVTFLGFHIMAILENIVIPCKMTIMNILFVGFGIVTKDSFGPVG